MVLMIALNVSAGVSGIILGKMHHYKSLPIAGLVLAIAATATLATWVESLDLFWFEVLLILIGTGFGGAPGLAQVAMQNNVPRHQLGIAVGTMNFTRNLLATILVATFGAIVAASVAAGGHTGGTLGGPLDPAAVEAFRRVFFGVTGTLAVALIAILLLEEKPLQTGVEQEGA
jgi:MFS family permease